MLIIMRVKVIRIHRLFLLITNLPWYKTYVFALVEEKVATEDCLWISTDIYLVIKGYFVHSEDNK